MYTIFRNIVKFFFCIAFNIKFEGVDNIPQHGGVIFACNHRSYADPILMALKVKKPFSYMAKSELFKGNAFEKLIRFFGAFPVERGKGDLTIVDTCVDVLKSGRNLAIFPEGTRSKNGKLGRGKTGVALVASQTGADVVPMAIVYGEKLKFRTKVIIRYGEVIKAQDLQITSTSSLKEVRVLKNRIMGSIEELLYKDGKPDFEKMEAVKTTDE